MNILIATDFHLKEQELEECNLVLDELISLKEKGNITQLIIAGDTFDKVNPTSKEIDCFSHFVEKINIPIILIVANSHESTSPEESILNHFGILKKNITIVKEYQDEKHLFVGHFIVKESTKSYGAIHSKEEYKDYKYVVLGHQHSHELIKPNICQLGAVRYIDFGEVEDKKKVVLAITNYKEDNEKCVFLTISSCFPMIETHLTSKPHPEQSGKYFEAQLRAYLDSLDAKTKVKVIFDDFEGYRSFMKYYNVYKNKFVIFKDRKDFITKETINISEKKDQISLKESFDNYCKINSVEDSIKNIIKEELK